MMTTLTGIRGFLFRAKLLKPGHSFTGGVLLALILTQTAICGTISNQDTPNALRKARAATHSLQRGAALIKTGKALSFFNIPANEKKIGPRLAKALRIAKTEGGANALQALKASQVTLSENETGVITLIRAADGFNLKDVESSLSKAGATIMRSGRETLKASVPLSAIESVAALPEVGRMRTLLPPRKKAVVTSEGVAATQADTWHGYGFTGAGAKVAIVDTGFRNLLISKISNEIPSSAIEVNFSTDINMSDSDMHGTACAEIVYDMAPDAQLYLIKIDDVTDLIAVKDYCIAQEIDIISCSLGWDIMNFHDGMAYDNWFTYPEDHPVTAVNQADAAGIFCAFAAGNEQQQQSLINWGSSGDYLLWDSQDTDLNLLYNIDGGTIIPSRTTLFIDVTWNEWPLSSNDFDIYLYKNTTSGWVPVTGAWSQEVQDGSETSYPMESIAYETTSSGEYAISVDKYDASSSPTFLLRYYGVSGPHYFGYNNYLDPVPGSIAIPGDAASCFTVGALFHSSYTSGPIEYYSSLGPNNRAYPGGTAVTKPDICAPTGVDTRAYSDPFFGTSSSTPHVAGLAALIKGVYPSYSSTEIKQYIRENGFNLGPAGADNTYGSGAALLPSQLPATVSLSNLIHDYDGSPHEATATTVPAGLTVDLTYDGSASAPTVLGSYLVAATINNTPFYGAATNTLTIVIDPEIESGALEVSALTTPSGSVILQFTGIPGGTYSVMTRSALNSGSWQPIGSITLDGNGTASFTDSNPPAGSRFYMLKK